MGCFRPWNFCQREYSKMEKLWDYFIQEEMRVGSKHAGQQQGEDEENVAFSGKGKGRANKSSSGRGGYLKGL